MTLSKRWLSSVITLNWTLSLILLLTAIIIYILQIIYYYRTKLNLAIILNIWNETITLNWTLSLILLLNNAVNCIDCLITVIIIYRPFIAIPDPTIRQKTPARVHKTTWNAIIFSVVNLKHCYTNRSSKHRYPNYKLIISSSIERDINSN